MTKVNIPQNLVSGIASYGTLQIATEDVKKVLGDSPHSIDMIELGLRTRTTRSVGEIQKYNIKVGDIVTQFGKSADGSTKSILTKITAIHYKDTPEFLSTWNKEGWTIEGITYIKRFKQGAAAIEFELVSTPNIKRENTINEGGKYLTFNEWRSFGYGILKGEKSHKRNKNNECLFSEKQVRKINIRKRRKYEGGDESEAMYSINSNLF